MLFFTMIVNNLHIFPSGAEHSAMERKSADEKKIKGIFLKMSETSSRTYYNNNHCT